MRGVTKPIVLDLIFVGKVVNPMSKKEVVVFNIKGKLKRSDYVIGEKYPAAVVGNDVMLIATAELSPAQ